MYCRMINFRENVITRVLQGSLDSPNIMLAHKRRMSDATLAKFKFREHQMYPNRKLNAHEH